MSPRIVPLAELCDLDRRGLRPDDPDAARLPLLGVENVASGTGAVNLDTRSRVGEGKSTSFRFDDRHVLYAKLRPYLNKVATPEFAGRCSTELVPLLPRPGVDRGFLAYLLRRRETVAFAMSSVTGSRMPRADMKALMSMPAPLPPLDEQRRIVDILNRAARIQALRRRAADRLREFVPALFVRMFGDPGRNPMRWPQRGIGDVCEVQGGLQVSQKRSVHPLETPYLRVANVLRDRLVLDTIKLIRLTESELVRTRLLPGDLLFVEGHGNPTEIGRVAVWDGQIRNCVHQNHLIRARPDQSRLLPAFAAAYLNSSSGRQHLLGRGKTTSGLNTITTSDVRTCGVFLPPLDLQRRFAEVIHAARAIAHVSESSTRSTADLIVSLDSELFRTNSSELGTQSGTYYGR